MEGPERVVCCSLCLCMAVAVFSSVALVYLTALVRRIGNTFWMFEPFPGSSVGSFRASKTDCWEDLDRITLRRGG